MALSSLINDDRIEAIAEVAFRMADQSLDDPTYCGVLFVCQGGDCSNTDEQEQCLRCDRIFIRTYGHG